MLLAKFLAALRRSDRIITTNEILEVKPHQDNLHQLTALTDFALLDVLAPPYLDGERDCTFYQLKKKGIEFDVLEETYPFGYICDTVPYLGPRE